MKLNRELNRNLWTSEKENWLSWCFLPISWTRSVLAWRGVAGPPAVRLYGTHSANHEWWKGSYCVYNTWMGTQGAKHYKYLLWNWKHSKGHLNISCIKEIQRFIIAMISFEILSRGFSFSQKIKILIFSNSLKAVHSAVQTNTWEWMFLLKWDKLKLLQES